MSEEQAYFSILDIGRKWPFSIYHKPIEDTLLAVSRNIKSGAKCLNIGCGLFDSYPRLKSVGSWYACDINPRCIEVVSSRYPEVNAKVCTEKLEYQADFFDFIIATEVIEHIAHPLPWLESIFTIAKSGSTIVISTPNYGFSILPLVEYTFLEAIARTKGFSRFGLHQNKYTVKKLYNHLSSSVPAGSEIKITRCSLGMALIAIVQCVK